MGGALLRGWLDAIPNLQAVVVDPFKPDDAPKEVTWVENMQKVPEGFAPDVAVIAVKPQMMDEVMPTLVGDHAAKLYVSVAAGKTTDYFKQFTHDAPLVRVMPNTPAMVGEGMSALYATSDVQSLQREWAEAMMQAVGKVIWLDEEAQMDAFTAVAGSGPAYIFHLIEAMEQAAIAVGLPEEQAAISARQTVVGAAALAASSSDTPTKLRENVTSPGGTTAAALEVLMASLPQTMTEALEAAVKRAKEL